jgi:hypothetical protein
VHRAAAALLPDAFSRIAHALHVQQGTVRAHDA